ncbi:MAG TPA: ion transporter [Acidobacteriota bacterium]|nr:ion transporter [Acidobacteriota bacterium]
MMVAGNLVHRAFHEPDTQVYRTVQWIIWVLISVSVILLAIDFLLSPSYPGEKLVKDLDRVILWIFVVEITLRIVSFHPPKLDLFEGNRLSRLFHQISGRAVFCLRPLNLIDIITVSALIPALRGLRAIRLLRLLYTRRVFRYSNPYHGLIRSFRDNVLLYSFAFTALGAATLLGGISIYLIEAAENPGIKTLGDGIWWAIVTLTTVGFGDITPVSPVGRVVGAFLMVAGMFMLALFAGIVSQTILTAVLTIREEQFRMSTTLKHVVICGYDSGARMLLDTIVQEVNPEETAILIFSNGNRPADLPPVFTWVSGDPTKESELDKIRLTHALAVIVVGSRAVPPQQADAQAILTVFTIRSYMRSKALARKRKQPLYVIAEILDAENVEHARSAGADEVIETTRLGFSLLAHAVTMPGAASIMSRVATVGELGLYVGDIPGEVITPTSVSDLSRHLKTEYEAILIGLQSQESGKETLNPRNDEPVRNEDRIIYMAESPIEREPQS